MLVVEVIRVESLFLCGGFGLKRRCLGRCVVCVFFVDTRRFAALVYDD